MADGEDGGRKQTDNSLKAVSMVGRQASRKHQGSIGRLKQVYLAIMSSKRLSFDMF